MRFALVHEDAFFASAGAILPDCIQVFYEACRNRSEYRAGKPSPPNFVNRHGNGFSDSSKRHHIFNNCFCKPGLLLLRPAVIHFHNIIDQESAIAAFLHAARLEIFELSWNVLCPGCVLTAGAWIVALITSVPLFSVLYMLIVQGGFRMSRHMGHRHFLRCFCYSADGAARYS
jgi:hypothetical protein